MDKYPRKCDCCGAGMIDGFLDAGSYYCSEECLLKANREHNPDYTMEDWEKDVAENDDECYYTEWYPEDIEDDDVYYDEDGNPYLNGEPYTEDD